MLLAWETVLFQLSVSSLLITEWASSRDQAGSIKAGIPSVRRGASTIRPALHHLLLIWRGGVAEAALLAVARSIEYQELFKFG